jgi:hypothetical protein
MSGELILPMVMRWLHIGSAMLAIGAPFFVRFALMPAAGSVLDEAAQEKLRERINARWRHVVYVLITLFLISGLYTFLVPVRIAATGPLVSARWRDFSPEDKRLYHMIFGIKMLCALGIFFLASALAGRTATFAPIRRRARTWVGVLLVLAAILVVCSTMLRFLPNAPVVPAAGLPAGTAQLTP